MGLIHRQENPYKENFGYATKDAEVLIDGEIPKEAYTVVKKHH